MEFVGIRYGIKKRMAKRFTDTEKWKKQFIKSLSTVHKLFFLYLLDDCDHAGIWHVEHDVAMLRIGEIYNPVEVKECLNNHIIEFDNGEKWFIPYFIEFQYGVLNENVNAHKSVIDKLKKYNLFKQFMKGSYTLMDKDMDKDKEKDERFKIPPTKLMVCNYCNSRENNVDPDNFINFYESKNWMIGKNKMKDWQAAIRTWEKNNFNKPQQQESGYKQRVAAGKELQNV